MEGTSEKNLKIMSMIAIGILLEDEAPAVENAAEIASETT